MLAGVWDRVEVWVGVRGETCLGIWLAVGTLAELETEAWRQGVGLWHLLREGTDVRGMGDEEGVGVKVWVGVPGVLA